MRRHECGLLPYIREDIYGMNFGAGQIIPWALSQFNIPEYWDTTEGGDVIVAVVDTGCDLKHPDLYKNLLMPGYNATQPGTYPEDRNGHGSHVAGTIAAVSNGLGVVGVAPKVKIFPVKALGDNGGGHNHHVADGVTKAVDFGCDLITMSLGSPYPDVRLRKALEYAQAKGVGVFCAAGNSGNHADVNYPAKYPTTVAIGSVGRKLNISRFSCTGNTIDFVAPGEDIVSCVPDGYAKLSGTSMATPFAVGCAALTLSYRKGKRLSLPRTSRDWVELLSKNTRDLPDPRWAGKTNFQGNGLVQPVLS